jgi:hypothetical protein
MRNHAKEQHEVLYNNEDLPAELQKLLAEVRAGVKEAGGAEESEALTSVTQTQMPPITATWDFLTKPQAVIVAQTPIDFAVDVVDFTILDSRNEITRIGGETTKIWGEAEELSIFLSKELSLPLLWIIRSGLEGADSRK